VWGARKRRKFLTCPSSNAGAFYFAHLQEQGNPKSNSGNPKVVAPMQDITLKTVFFAG